MILLICLIIFVFYNLHRKINVDISKTSFEGTILYYKINGNKLTMQVKNKDKILANYYIATEEEKNYLENNLQVGYYIKLTGSFEEPAGNTIPNTFNYKKYLKSKKIYLIMNTKKYTIIKKCNIFYKLKNFIIKIIAKRKNKEYYYAFILGNKEYLDSDTYNTYKINGITHLFAISGMHISMLIFILNKLKCKKGIIIIFLYLYSFLVMFTPSVLRVTIFYTLKNNKLFKDVSNTRILIYTACILIIYNPFILYDVGFLYSFIITLGLFIIKPKNIVYLSFYAFILSLPITIYNNFEFNLLSVFINILIVPLVSYLIYPLLLITIFIPILENILSILIKLLEILNLVFSKYSLMILIGKINVVWIIIYYIIFYLFIKKRKKIYIIILILILIFNKFKYYFNPNYYIYYLDVGQGDSSVIITPYHNDVIMIDTGGTITYELESWKQYTSSYDKANNLIQFLKSIGVKKINVLILSHGDYDHLGNAKYLIDNYKVDSVMINNDEINDNENYLITNISRVYKYQSKFININNLNDSNTDNENDNSLVFNIKLDNYYFTYLGDISSDIMPNIVDKINKSDIIKVAHHGSKYSVDYDFYNQIKPEVAIISCGKNNKYGHPSSEVLDLLANTKTYRTDIDGSIKIKLNKGGYEISNYSS
jgi:competence protein ComEC